MERAGGVLLSITSLPSKYGIGCFSKSAYDFVDWLKEAGQSYWQILPLGPTSYGDSPYQSFSTFAGNPYFISLEDLIEEGVLTERECEEAMETYLIQVHTEPTESEGKGQKKKKGKKTAKPEENVIEQNQTAETSIDYKMIYETRYPLLRKAYEHSHISENPEYQQFISENNWWLSDYALFMAVKDRFEGKPWTEWAEDIRLRWQNAMDYYRRELYFDIEFQQYLQYMFYKQWAKLKAYANSKGVHMIGDIPIYVAMDSADTWANPQLFQLDSENVPLAVAGCPPDGFSAIGQLWGNPLYRWEYHRETGYSWWISRLSHCFRLYDVVRIDHFRGFDEYYSIPFGSTTAIGGHWEKGPGIELFDRIKEVLGEREVIAEDLGYVTDSVRQLVTQSGFPGMKVLEFAFDSRDSGCASDYLPHNYPQNSVAYTGTHDNETIAGWFQSINEAERTMAREYLSDYYTPDNELYLSFISLVMRSNASLCVIPLQDYLGYDNTSRMNQPSTLGENWKWRVTEHEMTEPLQKMIRSITRRYGRLSWQWNSALDEQS